MAKKRKDNTDRDVAAKALLQLTPEVVNQQFVETGTATQTTPSPVSCVGIQTDVTCNNISDIEEKLKNTQLDCQELRKEKSELSEKVRASSLNVEDFDDNKVKFYTGLPNLGTFMLVLSFVTADLAKSAKHTLTRSQQLLMTLMKLRLNSPEEDLAYRFGVHQSTVSRIFGKWIDILSVCLEPLIMWPEREDLRLSLPMSFRTFFSKCVSIIDCFEVFVERPSDLKARAQTWSNYKQHNTIKFLISITPQGTISFVSKGWGGRVTDKHLTDHCGFLNKLLPGDLVFADQGFTTENSVGFYCAEVVLPPFTRGKKQLSKREVERAREISHVRIHVERVIGMLRQKYTILESTLPLSLVRVDQSSQEDKSIIDKIVYTCSALCNICKSVVPSE